MYSEEKVLQKFDKAHRTAVFARITKMGIDESDSKYRPSTGLVIIWQQADIRQFFDSLLHNS